MKSRDISRRLASDKTALNYEGVELAPNTLESLVTWDICGHARREQDRLSVACRVANAMPTRRRSPDDAAPSSP
jgi:hypothetical protein